jgi:hypothetical protein
MNEFIQLDWKTNQSKLRKVHRTGRANGSDEGQSPFSDLGRKGNIFRICFSTLLRSGSERDARVTGMVAGSKNSNETLLMQMLI